MTRSELIESINGEYRELRRRDEEEALERIRYASERDPEIGKLADAKTELMLTYAKKMMENRSASTEYAAEMRNEGLRLNGMIGERLKALGMEPDAQDVKYRCGICKDTGYVGIAPKVMCDCFKRRLHERLSEERGLASLEKESFETYRDDFIPDELIEKRGVSQRTYTRALMEACRSYADTYPKNDRMNLLMYGETGLGKTFLLNSTAGRLYARGVNVMRVTAYTMFDAMRRYHFGKEDDSTVTFDDLLNAPVLFIDDLGTEPMQANITDEYIFVLLNERLHSGLGTVIATNLSPKALLQRYNERVYSRLCDRGNTQVLEFAGKDLRTHDSRRER